MLVALGSFGMRLPVGLGQIQVCEKAAETLPRGLICRLTGLEAIVSEG